MSYFHLLSSSLTRSLHVTSLRLGDAGDQGVQPTGNSNLATGLGARVRGVVFDDLWGSSLEAKIANTGDQWPSTNQVILIFNVFSLYLTWKS